MPRPRAAKRMESRKSQLFWSPHHHHFDSPPSRTLGQNNARVLFWIYISYRTHASLAWIQIKIKKKKRHRNDNHIDLQNPAKYFATKAMIQSIYSTICFMIILLSFSWYVLVELLLQILDTAVTTAATYPS